MIKEFVNRFMEAKPQIKAAFEQAPPGGYEDLVRHVIAAINPSSEYGLPDPNRIHTIDDGNYQGTLLYVIAEAGYQPNDYWFVRVSYGSCSGCDTFQAILCSDDKQQAEDFTTLALHIVQGLKVLGGEDE